MKGKLVLLLLLLLAGYLYFNGTLQLPGGVDREVKSLTEEFGGGGSTESASTIAGELEVMGLQNVSVSATEGSMEITFTAPYVGEVLESVVYSAAKKAYEKSKTKEIRVEAYFEEEPVLAMVVENGDFTNPTFEDIRRPEFKIESDLGLFDVVVHEVKVTNDTASVSLEYLAGNESFWRDYAKMSLAILEDAPWVGEVGITYLGERNVTFSIAADKLLDALSGELSPEEFAKSVRVSEGGN